MKKIILTGLVGLLLIAPAWAQNDKEYIITGKIENQGKAKVVLGYADKSKANGDLKQLYQQYKDKGFEILGIAYENGASLQEQKKSWLQAVTEDGLPWIQLLNNEGADKQDIVKLYGISAFPTKILLDKEGKILARYTGDGTDIDGKLAELMKQP